MAVTLGQYKAHFWTWTNSWEEFSQVGRLGAMDSAPPYPVLEEDTAKQRRLAGGFCGVVTATWPCDSHLACLSVARIWGTVV